MNKDDLKRAVGFAAVDRYLKDARHIGLGSGSTAVWAVRRLAELYQEQPTDTPTARDYLFVASSTQSLLEGRGLGLPIREMGDPQIGGRLDLVIDGADEVDRERHVLKGGGASLLWEKILAYNADRVVLVVDSSKLSENLCERFPIPVEIVPGAHPAVFRALASLGGRPELRMAEKKSGLVVTDSGNHIADGAFDPPIDARHLEIAINSIPGVVENGLFTMIDPVVLVGREEGEVEEFSGA